MRRRARARFARNSELAKWNGQVVERNSLLEAAFSEAKLASQRSFGALAVFGAACPGVSGPFEQLTVDDRESVRELQESIFTPDRRLPEPRSERKTTEQP